MHIRVDLLPSPPYDDVVILIDVLRTCTVAPILFENGLQRLHLATKLKLARNLAEETKWTLLGERKGLPPEGFNYGNSPAALRTVALHGAEAVLVSENAPVTMPLLDGAEYLLLGSLYNADAVVERALRLAKKRVYLVCSGLWGREDLDDTLAAGFLAARMHYRNPAAELGGAARLAINLVQAFPDPLEAFWRSSSGQYLRSLNLLDDLAVASLVSQTEHVPTLVDTRNYEQGTLYSFVSEL